MIGVRRSPVLVGAVLAAGCLLLVVASAGLGAYPIGPGDVVDLVASRAGLGRPRPGLAPEAGLVLFDLRLPRAALALVVGGCLGAGGAVLQGLFRNPLAEPGVIGASTGAALGAVVAIASGLGAVTALGVPAAAFVGGLLTTAAVHRLARHDGRTEVVGLVLTGIAVNAFAGAAIGLVMFVVDDAALRSITFWNLGSLASATWLSVGLVAPLAAIGIAAAPSLGRKLDLLSLGESEAGHLGVDVVRTRRLAIALVAALTAGAVASAGVIAFVGLLVPHLVRLLIGPSHRSLVAVSTVAGAGLLLAADLAARTIVAPMELPLGVLTALLGAPGFLVLLARARRELGGFA